MPYEDVVNISMNQVLMRSLMTSLSSIIPVLSLLILGAGVMGAVALQEFALALLIGVGAFALFGWWWADPIGALAMLPVIVWQGWGTLSEARE